jgi:hypothetical protein
MGESARERFDRRAQEIARDAQVRERPRVANEPDLSPFREKTFPEIGDERGLARRNPSDQIRGEHADAGVQERGWAYAPESRDRIPFGLQRRVAVGLSIVDDEKRRRGAGLAMPGEQSRGIEGDGRVGINDEKVFSLEPQPRVAQGSGGPEDPRLPEKIELRKLARMLAEAALDLVAQVMEVDARLSNAGAAEPLEMSDD